MALVEVIDSGSDHGDSSTAALGTSADNTSNSETSSNRAGTINTRDETTSQDTDEDCNNNEYGPKRITRKWLLEFFKKDWKTYYRTFELNERLYLHYKGFNRLENMHLFPELKCLYFEGNGLTKMTGLEENKMMRTLNLHENIIKKMEGIDHMDDLRTLQLSDNCIETIEGLQGCKKLVTLYIKNNNIGRNGL